MYVSVKGGETAIEHSWGLLAAARPGDPALAELEVFTPMGPRAIGDVANVSMSETPSVKTGSVFLKLFQGNGGLKSD